MEESCQIRCGNCGAEIRAQHLGKYQYGDGEVSIGYCERCNAFGVPIGEDEKPYRERMAEARLRIPKGWARQQCEDGSLELKRGDLDPTSKFVERRLKMTIGCIGIGNTSTMATLTMMFAVVAIAAVAFAETNNVNLVAAARRQIGVTVGYDPAYRKIGYPGGDVPRASGVCTDVIIRALRDAHKMDLQKLVHEDMKSNFAKYPRMWGLKKPDSNIDHRRVPNLQCYFKRKGYALPVSKKAADYKPGDIVTVMVGGKLPHIMIVSDRKSAAGVPLALHNIGLGTQEEDVLFAYPLTGHYRIP